MNIHEQRRDKHNGLFHEVASFFFADEQYDKFHNQLFHEVRITIDCFMKFVLICG